MPKIIHDTSHEDYVPEKKGRSKVKVWVEPDSIKQYRLERDRIIFTKAKKRGDTESINQILAYYGKI